MITYNAGNYDVIVVGAGHAGCEAALASARLGLKTLMCTMNIESLAFMPCNPNIGGTSKGHLVRELDALGGEMGVNIDKTLIQSRMLNTSKGPAVHSLRAQADKVEYQKVMRKVIENTDNLYLKQIEVTDLIVEDGVIRGVTTRNGGHFMSKAVILATGTYLASKIIIGEANYESGPNGLSSSKVLSENLGKLGFEMQTLDAPGYQAVRFEVLHGERGGQVDEAGRGIDDVVAVDSLFGHGATVVGMQGSSSHKCEHTSQEYVHD